MQKSERFGGESPQRHRLPVVVAEVALVLGWAVVTLVTTEVLIALRVPAAGHGEGGCQPAQLRLTAVRAGRVR